MNQNQIRSSWKQRIASLMVIVLIAGSLLSEKPSVYAAESVPETEGQVSTSEPAGQYQRSL